MHIRRARGDEAPRIFAIWKAATDATHDFLTPEDRAFFAAIVRDQYAPSATPWVAVDGDDRPLGFMELNDAKIDALFVDGRGQGVGSRLIAHAFTLHDALKVDVNEANHGAVGFYRAKGFEVIGRSELDDSGKPYPILHMATR